MANFPLPDEHTHLTPGLAVQLAAAVWGAMLVLLLGVAVFVLWLTLPAMTVYVSPARSDTFLPVILVAAIVVPAALLTHWYMFRSYWQGGLVQPRGYLLASIILYSALTLCAVLALLGAVIDRSIFPNVFVAALLVLVLLSVWPAGRAMRVRRSRSEEDDDVELLHWAPDDEQEQQNNDR